MNIEEIIDNPYNLELHVHDDMDFLFKNTNIPLVMYGKECYIMQEDRIVYFGTKKNAAEFIKFNRGKLLKDYFPDIHITYNAKKLINEK